MTVPARDVAVIPPRMAPTLDRRVLLLSGLAVLIAFTAGLIAQLLVALIGLITNLAFHQRWDSSFASPAGHSLGLLVIGVPVAGALGVGLMARYGSAAIRGHGIPEAMEQVLFNQSRIPFRVLLLKPLSAAISIGTGGPFGAEGPIIATGGALGSLVGQFVRVTADERKTLLAAGAAAGMAATFGSPVSAVLLAIELLLFEYRPRSIIPVSLAAVTAAGVRIALNGPAPAFAMRELVQPGGPALAAYILLGALIGVMSVGVTRALYAIEDGFEKLPVHWMWWPALGAVVVGVIGYISPHTLGVGYDNIEHILNGEIAGRALLILAGLKLLSWLVALGSGTSGGTLAPLFTIGGGAGGLLGAACSAFFPALGVDIRIAALVGMTAMFAGASRALLASVVFAFETTRQPLGLLPLLGGCAAAYLVSHLLMRNSIMTEKIARRGVRVPAEYSADHLDQVRVGERIAGTVTALRAGDALGATREWLAAHGPGASHQGFPVVDDAGRLVGVLTRRDLLDPTRSPEALLRELITRVPVVVFPENSLREAADHMVREGVGRLPVVTRDAPRVVIGMISRGDLLGAHQSRLDDAHLRVRHLDIVTFVTGRRRDDGPSPPR